MLATHVQTLMETLIYHVLDVLTLMRSTSMRMQLLQMEAASIQALIVLTQYN
jgi:hypothetical protein